MYFIKYKISMTPWKRDFDHFLFSVKQIQMLFKSQNLQNVEQTNHQ